MRKNLLDFMCSVKYLGTKHNVYSVWIRFGHTFILADRNYFLTTLTSLVDFNTKRSIPLSVGSLRSNEMKTTMHLQIAMHMTEAIDISFQYNP